MTQWKERKTTLSQLDRSFDIEFWQEQEASARFAAAWELVEFTWKFKGRNLDELRLQRSVESIQRGGH
ncbi:hypothetical protein IAD21_04082 [Abditibacteriota bacterium]|nr:hypothetical protein IAD21_04082 [Abditibacteriota bacterium]